MTKNVFAAPPPAVTRLTVEDLLKRCEVGDQVHWDVFASACGLPRGVSLYAAVAQARQRLVELGMHFVTRHGLGVERIDDNGMAVEVLPAGVRKIQRAARRTRVTYESVNLLQVHEDNRLLAIASGSLAAMTEAACAPRALKSMVAQRELSQIGRDSLDSMAKKA
jgi:hypothetical protein